MNKFADIFIILFVCFILGALMFAAFSISPILGWIFSGIIIIACCVILIKEIDNDENSIS